MKSLLVTNVGWKLLSLLLSFLLWIAVAQDPELTTSISVPILFKQVPADLEIAGTDSIERAHLEIRGPSGRLTAANLSQVAVIFNMSTRAPGEQTFTISDKTVWGLPLGVAFYRAVPSQVSLTFEHQISKEVPVEPAYEKPPPPGYAVVSYHFSPARVKIRGPEQQVKDVDRVTTDPIDLTQVKPHSGYRVHVRLSDPQIRLDTPAAVVFTANIQKVSTKESK